jgi:squalene cyclase
VWDAISRSGGWTGGGMTPRRLDRAAILARLPDVPGWILQDLMDAAEPAALAAEAKAREREKKNRKSSSERRSARRAPPREADDD